MSLRVLTNMLLVVYSLSIMGYGIIETSHGLLHSLKNNVHFHDHERHHHIEDHHIILHDDASQTNHADSTIPIYSYFLFFEHLIPLTIDLNINLPYPREVILQLKSIYSTP